MENSPTTKRGRTSKLQEEIQRFQKDTAYFESHRDELLEEYPEQWVAILNEKVVGTAEDARELLVELKKRDIPVGQALVKHLSEKEELFILNT